MLSAYFSWFHIKTGLKRLLVGKAMISGSFLFLYGSYGILFVMHYLNQGDDTYTKMFFHSTSFVAMLFMSTALYYERKRVIKMHELKITRRELNKIYNADYQKSRAASLEAALSPAEYQF
ncbi:MAG: hypothetical protein EOO20_28015 [Chryseobacterium sp.]|nr:MAG: hypothetical protein EOO20_28015 [Chryseobacterium sp.]